MSRTIVNLQDHRFGNLLVVSQHSRDKWGQVMWLCKCDCGKEVVVASGNLRYRPNVSCGCLKAKRIGEQSLKHGHTTNRKPTREYRSWQGMKKRCLDSSHIYYKNYGGRGITICDRWINSFENFYSDMGDRPARYSLDRIDVDGNYEPSNCRWASPKEQAQNKRKNST